MAGAWVVLVAVLTSQVATGWLALRDSLAARGIDPTQGVTARSWIQAGKLGVALGATTPIVL